MDRLIEFAANHPFLVMALVGVVAAIVVNEVMQLRTRGQDVEPGEATRLYNRENALFVDVRGENAFVTRHLPGAVNLPLAHLEASGSPHHGAHWMRNPFERLKSFTPGPQGGFTSVRYQHW